MSVPALLEVGTALGSIVGVWYVLIGWKVISPTRADPLTRPEKL
jgi:hypothetical protein